MKYLINIKYSHTFAWWNVQSVVQSTKVPTTKKDQNGLLVRVVGLEPTRSCPLRILSPVRLPFRHTRATFLLYIKIVTKAIIVNKFFLMN